MADKFHVRRAELAASALATLAERGYANTSLRDIADNSHFSHGVLHYYFADKTELIIAGVRAYKAECMTRYDAVVEQAITGGGLLVSFADAMVATLLEDGTMHRLWYDMRAQSYFDREFREDVGFIDRGLRDMIWRVVSKYAELEGREPALSQVAAYGLFDGIFQQAVRRYFSHEGDVAADLHAEVMAALAASLKPA